MNFDMIDKRLQQRYGTRSMTLLFEVSCSGQIVASLALPLWTPFQISDPDTFQCSSLSSWVTM